MAQRALGRAPGLLEAMNAVAALEDLHFATSGLQIEQAYPKACEYLIEDEFERRFNILTGTQAGQDAADLATTVLSTVVSDCEKLRGLRREIIGNHMGGGSLSEPHGTPVLELALHEWLSSTDADGGSEDTTLDNLAHKVYAEATKLQKRRTKPTFEDMKRYKTEVERLIGRLRFQVPDHISQVEQWIRRDYVGGQVNCKALAVIACGRSGIELLADSSVTDLCYLVRGGNPVVAVMACDNPLARWDRMAIFQQAACDDGQLIRRLVTGDMWVKRVATIECFSNSRSACERCHNAVVESQVVMGQLTFLPKSHHCTEEEISYLYCIRQGFSDVVDKLHDGLLHCAASCAPPEGRCSAREVLQALNQMKEDVPSLFSDEGIGLGLSIRSISALFAASTGRSDFGERIARRMVGCLSTDSLRISHSSGELVFSQVCADVVMSEPTLQHTGASAWFLSELRKLAESRGVSWCGGKRPEERMHEGGYVLDPKYGSSVHELWRRHGLQVVQNDSTANAA